jgi:hypothetical protein
MVETEFNMNLADEGTSLRPTEPTFVKRLPSPFPSASSDPGRDHGRGVMAALDASVNGSLIPAAQAQAQAACGIDRLLLVAVFLHIVSSFHFRCNPEARSGRQKINVNSLLK